jgi:hypothetical protein
MIRLDLMFSYNNKNIYKLYKQFYISIKYNNLKNTPTMYLLNNLKNKFINNK